MSFLQRAHRYDADASDDELQQRINARNGDFQRCYALDASNLPDRWLVREDESTETCLAHVSSLCEQSGFKISTVADKSWTSKDLLFPCHGRDAYQVAGDQSDILDSFSDNHVLLLGSGRKVYKSNDADRKRSRPCDAQMCQNLFLVALGNFHFEYFKPGTCESVYNALVALKKEMRECVVVSLDTDTFISDPKDAARVYILPAGHYRVLETNFLTFKHDLRTVALPVDGFIDNHFIGGSYSEPIRLNPEDLAATIVPIGVQLKQAPAHNSTIHFASDINDGRLLGFIVSGPARKTHMLHPNFRLVHASTDTLVGDSDGYYVCSAAAASAAHKLTDTQPDKEDAVRDGIEIEYVCAAAPSGKPSRAVSRLLLSFVLLSYKDYCPTSITLYSRLSGNNSAHISAHVVQFYSEFGLRLVLFQSLRVGSPSLASEDQRIIAALRDTGLMDLWRKSARTLAIYHLKYTPEKMRSVLPNLADFFTSMRASTNEAGLVDINKLFQLPFVQTNYVWQYDDAAHGPCGPVNSGLMFRHYPCSAELLELVDGTMKRSLATKVCEQEKENQEPQVPWRTRSSVATATRRTRMIEKNFKFMSGDTEILVYRPADETPADIKYMYVQREKTNGVQAPEHILQCFKNRPLVLEALRCRSTNNRNRKHSLPAQESNLRIKQKKVKE